MDHPIDKLSLQSALIYVLQESGPVPYMNHTLPISVFERLNVEQKADNNCAYSFRLNEAPCPVWKSLFAMNSKDGTMLIHGDVMTFTCLPAHLESRYAKTKEGIDKTNTDFASERERLLAQLQEIERKETERLKKQENYRAEIEKQFNSLEL